MAKMTAALVSAALVMTAACGEKDFGDLPKDVGQRALLCTRAGVMLIGTTRKDDGARFARVSAKARELANADGFYDLFPGSNDDPGSALGGEAAIQTAVGSHWLSTVNACFAAYGIDQEPVPTLPQTPYDRALACAAATAYDTLGAREIEPQAQIADDPQGGYFIHKAAVVAGGGDRLAKASDDATAALQQVALAGTAHLWAGQCRGEDARAVTAVVSFPAAERDALLICDDALSFAQGGGVAKGARQTPAAQRYAAAYRSIHARLGRLGPQAIDRPATDAAVATVAGAGRLDQIGDACIARFPKT